MLAAMALSIKTAEAVTRALRERLERERGKAAASLPTRIKAFTARVRPLLDTRPVTRAEWDAACDDPLLTEE